MQVAFQKADGALAGRIVAEGDVDVAVDQPRRHGAALRLHHPVARPLRDQLVPPAQRGDHAVLQLQRVGDAAEFALNGLGVGEVNVKHYATVRPSTPRAMRS